MKRMPGCYNIVVCIDALYKQHINVIATVRPAIVTHVHVAFKRVYGS